MHMRRQFFFYLCMQSDLMTRMNQKGFFRLMKIRGRSLLKLRDILFSGEVFLFDDLNRHILASPQFEGSSSLV